MVKSNNNAKNVMAKEQSLKNVPNVMVKEKLNNKNNYYETSKTIVLLFYLIILSVHAQTEHAKFMGIPINTTITQFQQKLQAKGINYDQAASRELGASYPN
jgi:hypothetical protein